MTDRDGWTETDPVVRRRVLGHAPALMLVAFNFAQGAEGRLHGHPHLQATLVAPRRLAFTVAGETREIGPRDRLVIPSDALHGCAALEAGRLIDSFARRRDDFL